MGYWQNMLDGTPQPEEGTITPQEAVPMNLDKRAEQKYGMDPNVQRLGMLPYPKGSLAGDKGTVDWTDWVAPEFVYQTMKSTLAPGHLMEGGTVSPEEITQAAVTTGLPAMRGPGGTSPHSLIKPTSKKAIAEAPTTQALKDQAQVLYKEVESSDAVIGAESFGEAVLGLRGHLENKAFRESMHGKSSAALKEIEKYVGEDIPMSEIAIIRRLAKDAKGSKDNDDARIGKIMLKYVDDFSKSLKEKDMVSGDAKNVVAKLGQADKLYSQSKKSETIDKIFTNAETAVTGAEHDIRTQVRNLLKKDVARSQFSAKERKLLVDVANGTKTVNALKLIGKAGPSFSGQSKSLMPWAVGVTSALTGGLDLAAITAGGGMLSAKLAEMGTKGALNRARAEMAGAPQETRIPGQGTQGGARTVAGTTLSERLSPNQNPQQPTGRLEGELLRRFLASGGA